MGRIRALLIAVGLWIGGCAPVGSNGGGAGNDGGGDAGVGMLDPRLELRANDHVLGDSDAPVVVIEYGDFECSVCGRFAREVFPTIETEYVDSGRVKWVFRHLPLFEFHPHALRAAAASECAAEQGSFDEYIEALFNHQDALADEDLGGYAADLGLDGAVFGACMDSDRHDERIDADRAEAIDLGATGTPTFFIDGAIQHGFVDLDSFRALLDAENDENARRMRTR